MKTIKWILLLTIVLSADNAAARLIEGETAANESSGGVVITGFSSWLAKAQTKVAEVVDVIKNKMDNSRSKSSGADAVNNSAIVVTPELATNQPSNIVPAPQVLGTVEADSRKQFQDTVENVKGQLASKETIVVSVPGREAAPELPKTGSGVAKIVIPVSGPKGSTSKLSPVAKIPRADIGLERTISKTDLLPPGTGFNSFEKRKIVELQSPKTTSNSAVSAVTNQKIQVAEVAKKPQKNGYELGQLVSLEKIKAVPMPSLAMNPKAPDLPVNLKSPEEMKMLRALLLISEGDKCHMASGLLGDLANHAQLGEEANFHLGICAHKMGFHSEAVSRLLNVVKSKNHEFLSDAVANLVEDLPREYDAQVVPVLKAAQVEAGLSGAVKDNFSYVFARAAHGTKNYDEAIKYAGQIEKTNKLYGKAQYLLAIGFFGDKKIAQAEAKLVELRQWLEMKGNANATLDSLVNLNLARVRFAKGDFKGANDSYLQVPKDHPLWIQGLIEQGWAQLNMDDAPGAIGNMYSLHSPYFKSVFIPESWVVRTLGYIDICQYGDAYKTLGRLEQQYVDWMNKVDGFIAKNKTPDVYYNLVKTYLKNKSDANQMELPYQVIREIGRQRSFLNVQGFINVLEDELTQYNFIKDIIRKDQAQLSGRISKTKERIAKLTENLNAAKTNPALVKNVSEWTGNKRAEEILLRRLEFRSDVYKTSSLGYEKLKTTMANRVDRDKGNLRTRAGQELAVQLKGIKTRIAQILEGNEFLRYEIFAGSGESIRYQNAGGAGQSAQRLPANVKPQKLLNWEFDGEYWEDEIGSYRSTLKNNCPKK
jgi:hypothetical protein